MSAAELVYLDLLRSCEENDHIARYRRARKAHSLSKHGLATAIVPTCKEGYTRVLSCTDGAQSELMQLD